MISCRELVDFLMDYLSGELEASQRAAFEEHLAACPWCVAYMQTYQQTVQLGKAALQPSSDPVPENVPDELVRAILSARKKLL